MSTATTKKAPVGVLADLTDEGLNPTTITEQENMHQPTVPTRIQLDERSRIDVEPVGEDVELTITTVDEITVRSTFGMAFTASEVRRIASALLDGVAPDFHTADPKELEEHATVARKVPVEIPVSDLAAGTVTDIFRWSRDNNVRCADTMRVVETYLRNVQETESVTPAEWCRQRRQRQEA